MGFYKFIKNVIKFVLYQMPKRWLIMIIFALVFAFGLTSVKAVDIDYSDSDLVVYDSANIRMYTIDTPYILNNDYTGKIELNFSMDYTSSSWVKPIAINNALDIQTGGYPSGNTAKISYSLEGHTIANNVDFNWNQPLKFTLDLNNDNSFYINDNLIGSTTQYNLVNSNNNVLRINSNQRARSFLFNNLAIYNTAGIVYHYIVPIYYDGSKYLYDIIDEETIYTLDSSVDLGNPINKPSFTIEPRITTDSQYIENYTFSFLNIDGGDMKNATNFGNSSFYLLTDYMGITLETDLQPYKSVDNNYVTFSVPKSVLIDNPSIKTGRNVSFRLLYYIFLEGGRDIIEYDLGSYTFDLSNNTSEENQTIAQDQTLGAIAGVSSSVDNLNNSVQETNNFLTNTNVGTDDKKIDVPNIPNSEVATQIDGTFTSLFGSFETFLGDTDIQGVNIYIPNMTNGNILSTIYIPSNYVSAKLSTIPLFFMPGRSMLDLVVIVWYVLFTLWFLYFGTNLITLLYSGLIMQAEGLEKLTDTYTGISKNML